MPTETKHIVLSKSFWSGDVTAYCGLVTPKNRVSPAKWGDKLCPGCKTAERNERNAKKKR